MVFFLRKVGGSRFGKEENSESTPCAETKEKATSISGVWGSNGKIFIASKQSKQLVATDTVPRPKWNERYFTIIESESCSSPIVTVLPNPSNQAQIYVIHSNSITECFENNPQTNQWIKRHTFQLSNAKGSEILSVIVHPDTSMFFWCEKRASSLGLSSCCLCMREVPENWDTDLLSCIGTIAVILHSCPLMSLFTIGKGICLVPHLPDEHHRLLFFWTFVPRALKVHIWNHTTVMDLDKTDFKSIIIELLPMWHSFPSLDTKYILSLTTHPSTLELLLLDNSYNLSSAVIQDGKPLIQKLSVLNIPHHTDTNQTVRELFAVGLFVGLVWESGAIDMFDSKSGTVLSTLTELNGLKLSVWTCAGTVPGTGIWCSGGIWDLKSSSVLEVAEIMQSSVKSIFKTDLSTDKDTEISVRKMEAGEMPQTEKEDGRSCSAFSCPVCHLSSSRKEFSGYPFCKCQYQDTTMSGPAVAKAFLHEWSLFPYEAKVALSSIISRIMLDSSESLIEKELLDEVVNGSFQSPVIALTLLFSHSLYKGLVIKEVQNFLEKFQSDENSDQKCIKSPLNDTLVPYMQKFVALVKKFEEILESSDALLSSLDSNLTFDATEAKEILNKLSLNKSDSESIFRLQFLHSRSPKEVVESCDHFLSFQSLGNENDSSSFSQQWRKLYRLEWKDGQWRKSRANLEDSNNPFLNLICTMLYSDAPEWLLNVKGNGLAVVNAKESDERVQEHISQSFLDCLPAVKVDTNPNSAHVHSKLLWAAGQEMQAMQILLRHQMWTQALDFFTSLGKDTNSLFLLFTMMIKAFLRRGAPKEVSLKALSLAPHGVCPYEIFSILRDNGPRCDEPFESSNQNLTIADVRPLLQKLII